MQYFLDSPVWDIVGIISFILSLYAAFNGLYERVPAPVEVKAEVVDETISMYRYIS